MTLSFIFTAPPSLPYRAAVPARHYAKADAEAVKIGPRLASALRTARAMPDEAVIASALRARKSKPAVNAIDWKRFDAAVMRALLPSLIVLYQSGASAGAKMVKRKAGGQTFAVGATLNFTLKNPRAIEWIRAHAGERVKQISDISRQAIRDLVEQSFTSGVPPRVLARQLRDYIGLDSRFAKAAQRFEQGLVDAGFLPAEVEKKAAAYADRLLRSRADRIAYSETLTASNQGQRLLWQDAREAGLLGADARREWIADADSCDDCQELDGTTAELDGEYEGGVDGPPLHPRCSCAEGLSFDEAPRDGRIEVAEMSREEADALASEIADSLE